MVKLTSLRERERQRRWDLFMDAVHVLIGLAMVGIIVGVSNWAIGCMETGCPL